MTPVLAARLVWIVLAVPGYALAVMSAVKREPVNDSGLVPGVVLGFMLVTAGWFAAELLIAVASRKKVRTVAILATFALVVGGPAILIWAPFDWVDDLPSEARRGLALLVLIAVVYLPGMTIVMLVIGGFAWIADRTPLLRRFRWTDELRRQGGDTPFWDPPSGR